MFQPSKFSEGILYKIELQCTIFQVKYVAEKIKLPESQVEKKLSQMILDHKFAGILDQETGVLVVFDEAERDSTYDDVIETVNAMSRVVDRLYASAQKLT